MTPARVAAAVAHGPLSPVEAIPEPGVIRARMAELIREQSLLRHLLRLSERKARDGQRAREHGERLAQAGLPAGGTSDAT